MNKPNKIKKLKLRESELLEKMKSVKLSLKNLLGHYEIPTTLKRLEELQNNNEIDTQTIGFGLWYDRPITPSPKDLIPFAITGGDSCYFAFITDFGMQSDLENCPIAFISPTDFDKQIPTQSNFLIANNIKEFLSLMIKLKYAEHLRYQDIYSPNINQILDKSISEFKEEETSEETERKNNIANILISEFKLTDIDNFHEHFDLVKKLRNSNSHLRTIDGLNIEFESNNSLIEVNGCTIKEYQFQLENQNFESKLVAIRNAPYKFNFSDNEYRIYKYSLIQIFKELNLEREYIIQDFEIEMDKISSEWLNIRKQIINDER